MKEANKDKKESARGDMSEARLVGIWSRAMALRGLKKVLGVSLEAARIPTLDENGAVVDVKYNPSAANAATKAIEVANKMLGYNLPDGEEDGEESITVIFDGMEEYSK